MLSSSIARGLCKSSLVSRVEPATLFQLALRTKSTIIPLADDSCSIKVFEKIDKNGDGIISKEDFRATFKRMSAGDLVKLEHSIDDANVEEESSKSLMIHRVKRMMEVSVSKIFPAGFGWQSAATVAENAGLQSNDISFYMATGLGDGLAVCLGHTLYFSIKKAVTNNKNIDIQAQLETGVFLGSAATCSGFIWQPTVNALQAAGVPFTQALVATGGAAVLAFFGGLRMGRKVYGNLFDAVEPTNYTNLKNDAALSVAIGGAAGAFLGTDLSYGATNWLGGMVGIPDTASAVTASCLAGSSTALGFSVVQMGQNTVYKNGKCWLD